VPTVVIAESTTGTARDAGVSRAVNAVERVAPLTEQIARSAGALRYAAGRPRCDLIDAIVVATADAYAGAVIVTADPGDMSALAAVRGRSAVVTLRRRS